MTALINAIAVEAALSRRLAAVHPLLSPGGDQEHLGCADLLAKLVESLRADPSADRLWLLLTAIWAAYPPAEDLLEAQRVLRLRSPVDALLHLLDSRMSHDSASAARYDLQIVTDRVVVDVAQSAADGDPNPTGEMVRCTLASWGDARPIVLTAWAPGRTGWRPLTPSERSRLLRDRSRGTGGDLGRAQPHFDGSPGEGPEIGDPSVCIVPWQTTVLLPEVPPLEVCPRLAALASSSGNRVVVVGHEFTPVLDADLVSPSEPSRFAHYLSVVKHSETVAAASPGAADGSTGFVAALAAQGIPGPAVAGCFIATEGTADQGSASQPPATSGRSSLPTVVSIGFLGPPADLARVLYSSETLWRKGIRFTLRLLEGDPLDSASRQTLTRLQETGHSVSVGSAPRRHEAAEALRSASFAIFVPRYEGYAPSLAGSLSNGTPVIATAGAYVDEHASRGGVLTIDHHDQSLIAAMQSLLTDAQRLAALRSAAGAREERTWSTFADDLWSIATDTSRPGSWPGDQGTDSPHKPVICNGSAGDRLTRPVRRHDAISQRPRRRRPRTALEGRAAEGPPRRGNLLDRRIRTFLSAIGESRVAPGLSSAIDMLEASLRDPSYSIAWLAAAVLSAEIPLSRDVIKLVRAARLGDGLDELDLILNEAGVWATLQWPEVEVVSDTVVVDIDHTARDLFATGIQRVSREVTRRWQRDHEVVLAGWTDGYRAFRRLSPAEQADALSPDRPETSRSDPAVRRTDPASESRQVFVPWRCKVLVPELPIEGDRPRRYASLARFSQSSIGVVGHDCVPLTAAETCDEWVDHGFALWLGALADMDRVATVSASSAVEYEGWKTMLARRPTAGPDVLAVHLAAEPSEPTQHDLDEARRLFGEDGVPIVLVVGSHEPRKNHLALLHAAELLWSEDLEFSLVFIGGNSWNSGSFEQAVATMRAEGNRVHLLHRVEDGLLWAAYRLAHCTVFPSLQEGFGLPVAESLASGTPVITSDYGSMREQSETAGVLLVNPRDDREIAGAVRRMLLDRPLRDRLAAEAATVPQRSWDSYAEETWAFLVDGTRGPNGR